jgi:hypothetical protein
MTKFYHELFAHGFYNENPRKTMRERVEDLGRLHEKLINLADHQLFELCDGKVSRRAKDFVEYFLALPLEKQHDILNEIAYGLEFVKDKIWDCVTIASGDSYCESDL